MVQTAWHLIVSSAEKCFWDSGKIESDQSVLVPYAGQALTREQEYQVSLEIWDNYGNRAKAETAFTTGIFDTGDFQAKMITHDFPPEETACPGILPEIFFGQGSIICLHLRHGTWCL